MLLCRTALCCPQWGPWNAAVRAARYCSMLCRTMLKMLVCRYVSSSHIHSACCACACVCRRACANARVVSCVSRTCAAIYAFTGNRTPVRDWSPRINVLSLRCMASQASSIHLPHHNVKKFVLAVSNFACPREGLCDRTQVLLAGPK